MNIEEMADRLGLNKSTVTTYLSNKAKREEILLKLGIKKKGARA
jgi:DNA-binding CsgD family transcriptional regulator